MKSLLPTLKERKRYLLFEIISKKKLKDKQVVLKELVRNISKFLGELKIGKMGLRIIGEKYNSDKQMGIIQVNHNHVNELKTALTLTKQIASEDVIITTRSVSGILNKALEKIPN